MNNNNSILNYIEKELEKRNLNIKILLLTKSGSYLYGTNTPESDIDYLGVFVNKDKKYYLGFETLEEINLSKQIKDINGKNTKDSIDLKLYDIKKFAKLAANCNPNIIELLFAYTNKNAIIVNTPEFKLLEENKDLFINKKVYNTFLNYAKSQLKKGIQKPENYEKILKFYNILDKYKDNSEYNKLSIGEAIQVIPELSQYKNNLNKDNLKIANLSFPRNYFLKKITRMLKEKIEFASHRKKQWEKYGYDTKFFLHLFRLLDEGETLINKQKLSFPLKDREFLLKIKKGKFKLEELQEMLNKKFINYEKINIGHLPEEANLNKIEEIVIDIIYKNICMN